MHIEETHSQNLPNTPNSYSHVFQIKSRTETIIEININNPEIKEGIIPELELEKGVYLSKAIVKVNSNNKAFATILNTRIIDKTIKPLSVTLEPLPLQSKTLTLHDNKSPSSNKTERETLLRENLRLDHLNSDEKKSILDICLKFNDIFYLPNDNLTCTSTIEHEIKITDNTPIFTKSYRLPEIHKDEVDKQINKMLKQGIIRPSASPWSSPLWVVPKKVDASGTKKWRVVVDYRKLNNITVGDAYPLPNIEDILDQLGHSKYFTTLDLASGYHQIPVKETDRQKTAFTTPSGQYEFTRMPFGLKTAPSVFQRLMNSVLSGLQGLQCFVYLDDIVIYASSLEQHSSKLKAIFDRLKLNNLKLQPDKCEFLRREVSYLGHVITSDGVKPNPDKVSAINNFPVPVDQKSIKIFLGLVGYYRKFISNFAQIAKPLTLLLKKDTPFVWTDKQQISFDTFRTILMNQPLLKYPNFNQEFNLTTDSSNFAIGSILSQGDIGKDLPIAYASRTLNHAEQNYSTTEKELLAIIWSVNHFRPYLYGRKFKIITDHKPLTWLFNCKDPGSRLVRWRLKISEYDYEIIYKSGQQNSNADALSRIKISNVDTEHEKQSPISLAITNKNDVFENFVQFHYKTQEIPKIEEIACNQMKYFPNILLYSKDLDDANLLSQGLRDIHDITNVAEPDNLHSHIKLDTEGKITYICICKQFHFDRLSYKDIFYSLRNLLVELKPSKENNKIYIHDVTINNKNIKKDMFCEIIYYLFKDTKFTPIILGKDRITPQTKDEISTILKENHDSKLAGHSGFMRTYKRIKESYKWSGMKKDIKGYIRKCPSCQINKTNFKPSKAPMEVTTTSSQPFERLAIDVVGPLPLTINGNRFILTMQDDLTKYSYAVPISNHEAQTIATELSKFITLFGIPKTILSDQGSDFTSQLMRNVSKLFQTKHIFSSPYHPQTNGALERSHLTLKDYLKHYINEKQNDWDSFIPFAMFAYNCHIHTSTGYSPYQVLFGNKPFLPNSVMQEPTLNYNYDDYVVNLKQKLNFTQKIARENLIELKNKSKTYYDNKIRTHNYRIGDFVYIENKTTTSGLNKKLSPNFIGPFEIVGIQSNNVKVKRGNKIITYHVNLLKPFVSGNNEGKCSPKP